MNLNVVFQDNASTIRLAENIKLSLGKRTRHLDICLFHVMYLIIRKEVTTEHSLLGKMLTDCFSEPFRMMRINIMIVAFRE